MESLGSLAKLSEAASSVSVSPEPRPSTGGLLKGKPRGKQQRNLEGSGVPAKKKEAPKMSHALKTRVGEGQVRISAFLTLYMVLGRPF